MTILTDLAVLSQRSGTNANTLASQSERAAFSRNTRSDIANIINQLNVVYNPLVAALTDGTSGTTDALSLGLSGNSIFSHVTATAASATAYWDTTNTRARTIKETFDVILTELATMQNQLTVIVTGSTYDDTAIWNAVNTNDLDIDQLVKDTHGPNYVLNGTGAAALTYSLSQIIDAIGPNFSGYVPTGNTYASTYPTLSLTVLLSNVTLDTTIPQATVTDLVTNLAAIHAFTGMDTAGATPLYSAHGAITFISDGVSLEETAQDLDSALATHASRHIHGGADEIDGDLIDIDYVPANYTPTISAPATATDHLAAHLAGIDAQIAAAAMSTLQAAYTAGAGTAGEIQLANAKGPIVIKNDTGTPLGSLLQLEDAASATVLTATDTELELAAEMSLQLESRAADPTAVAGRGQVYSKLDGGDTELVYQDQASNAYFLTRDGRVKELELGVNWVGAKDMSVHSGGAGPDVQVLEGATTATSATPFLGFKFDESEYAYFNLAPPRDEDGNRATRFHLELYTLVAADGSGGGSASWVFDVALHNIGGNAALNEGDDLRTPTWTKVGPVISTASVTADLGKLRILDFGVVTIATDGHLLPFQVLRDYAHASDTWSEDAGVLGARITWYR